MDLQTKAIELQKIFHQDYKTYWEETEAIKKYLESTEPVDVVLADVSDSLIEFNEEVDRMMGLYGNSRYTQAEALRDELAEKLDDIMRLGGNDR